MIHLLSAFAEHEASEISNRTKRALEQAKFRNPLLDWPDDCIAITRHGHGQKNETPNLCFICAHLWLKNERKTMSAHIGKIGHLPSQIREQLNHALCEGIPGNRLVDWLNSLPEVQAILVNDFDGRPITTQNLAKWCKTGLKSWRQEKIFEQCTMKVAAQYWKPHLDQIAAGYAEIAAGYADKDYEIPQRLLAAHGRRLNQIKP